jgi:hypothetical protein
MHTVPRLGSFNENGFSIGSVRGVSCPSTPARGGAPTLGDVIAIAQEAAGGDVVGLRFDEERSEIILTVRAAKTMGHGTRGHGRSLWLVAVDIRDGSWVQIKRLGVQ